MGQGGRKRAKKLAESQESLRIITAGRWRALLLAVALAPLGILNGCVGLAGSQPSNSQPAPQGAIQVTPGSVDFGIVSSGSRVGRSATVTNTGRVPVTISQASMSSTQFSTSGLNLPLALAAGQTASFQIWFTGSATGQTTASFKLASNHQDDSASITLTGSTGQPALSLSSSSLSFSNVAPGTKTTSSVTLGNTGSAPLSISGVSVSGAAFSVAGLSVPAKLTPGQAVLLTVAYAPSAAGNSTGSISITSNDPNSPATIALSGSSSATPAGQLALSASSLSFGSVVDGSSKSQTVTVSNTGSASLAISQAALAGTGYSVSGLSTPLTIAAGGSSSFSIVFAPSTAGGLAGSLTLTSDASNGSVSIALSGTGVANTYTMSAAPSSLSFGSVNVSSSASQSVTVANTGNSSITISQASASGAGISISGLSLPVTVAPSQSVSMNVQFAPSVAGTVSSTISVVNTQGGNTTVSVTGTGVQPGLSVTPGSVSFGNVSTTTANSQTIQLKNTGSASLTVSQAAASGAGFSVTGLALPLTLAAGQASTFNVQFAPQSAGSVSGSVAIVSNAPNSPSVVPLSGTGVTSTYTLAVNPASVSFGNVTTGSSATQSVTISNTGNANVTISQITETGAGFALTGASVPVTLAPSQSMTIGVQFAPSATGTASGSIIIVSDATNSPVIALSGAGVSAPVAHSVALTWNASTSTVVGYNVYRGTTSGGPYTKLNSSPVGALTFTDTTVQNGTTYYYVTTAVDSSGYESVYSNEVAVSIP